MSTAAPQARPSPAHDAELPRVRPSRTHRGAPAHSHHPSPSSWAGAPRFPRRVLDPRGALATVLIIGIASLSALFVQTSFSVDELQTNLSGLQQQHEVLREEVAQASSPQRVMEWARARGMQMPDRVVILHLPRRRATAARDPSAGRPAARPVVGMALALGGDRGASRGAAGAGVGHLRGARRRAARSHRAAGAPPRARSSIATGARSAITLDARDVYANPTLVTDPVGEAGTLAPMLGLPRADVDGRARDRRHHLRLRGPRRDRRRRRRASRISRCRASACCPSERRMYPSGLDRRPGVGVVNVDGVGDHRPRAAVRRPARRYPGRADRGAVGDGTGDRRWRADRPGAAARRRPRADDRSPDPVPGAAVPAASGRRRTTRRAAR